MVPPKPTFLTIALELRNKIYAYALEVPEEFQVCESPEIFSNELGLCDLIKRPIKYDPSQECHPSRTPENPKTSLNMICKQTADELKDIHVQFPILVFCAAECAGNFMRSLRISLHHCTWSLPYRRCTISRVKIWAVKIKTCADAKYNADGTITWNVMTDLNELDEYPGFHMKWYSMKLVSRKDTGDDDLSSTRVIEEYLEHDDKCPYLQALFEKQAAARGG